MKQFKGSFQVYDILLLFMVIMRNKFIQFKECFWFVVFLVDEIIIILIFVSRWFQQSVLFFKSVFIQNIIGVGNDENMLNIWKFLFYLIDLLNKISKVNELIELFIDEGVGIDMNEGQLLGDFEIDFKQLEVEFWS